MCEVHSKSSFIQETFEVELINCVACGIKLKEIIININTALKLAIAVIVERWIYFWEL